MINRTLLILGLLLCMACAPTPAERNDTSADPYAARDPFQSVNQSVFAFNLVFEKLVVKPIATIYRQIPFYGRVGISNVVTNLAEPANVLNGILQLDPDSALISFWRFFLNSTVGFAGLRDFAAEQGLVYQDQGFSKTLARYGVSEGPYMVLPIFGPSTARDKTGLIVDWFIDPMGLVFNHTQSIADTALDMLTTRDEHSDAIETLYYQSIDPYAATRATYLQHKLFQARSKIPK